MIHIQFCRVFDFCGRLSLLEILFPHAEQNVSAALTALPQLGQNTLFLRFAMITFLSSPPLMSEGTLILSRLKKLILDYSVNKL